MDSQTGAGAGGSPAADDFRSRDTPLEYWFLKVSSGHLALLVDWIVRRDRGEAEVRVSVWVRGTGRVMRSTSSGWHVSNEAVEIAGSALTTRDSSGSVGDVGWDLGLESDGTRLDPVPAPAKLLHPFDMELVVAPRVRFSGVVHVGGEQFTLDSDIGTLTHYWGRRLPDSWVWVSAHGLGDGDGVLEAAVLRTRLWGNRRLSVVGGYVLLQEGGSTRQVIAPAYGRISGQGDASRFELRARALGRDIVVTGGAAPAAYNDLGESIRQTLLGDVVVTEWGACNGSAGLEFRGQVLRP